MRRSYAAIALPIRPMPTMPTIAPVTCRPSICVGCQPSHRPARRIRSPSPARRAVARISVMAMSAVASVTTAGVLVTTTPAARAASTSMWLKPAPKFATSRVRSPPPANASAVNASPSVGMIASKSRSAARASATASGAASWRMVVSNRAVMARSAASVMRRVTRRRINTSLRRQARRGRGGSARPRHPRRARPAPGPRTGPCRSGGAGS